jgi:hypothetical protein
LYSKQRSARRAGARGSALAALSTEMRPTPEPLHELADVLEPDSQDACGRRAADGADFAFAPTVHVNEALVAELAPPSARGGVTGETRAMIVHGEGGQTHCMTPLAFPLPPAPEPEPGGGSFHARAIALARRALLAQLAELRDLWSAAGEVIPGAIPGAGLSARALALGRRARAMWSFWQWERADVARAALIGMGVFVVTASIGAGVAAGARRGDPRGDPGAGALATTRRGCALHAPSSSTRAGSSSSARSGSARVALRPPARVDRERLPCRARPGTIGGS